MNKIVSFWKSGYQTDKFSFYLEMISFLFSVTGSMILALMAKHPDMTIVYPIFFIGSITGTIAFYRRKLAWPALLTFYFSCVNILGYLIAIGWW